MGLAGTAALRSWSLTAGTKTTSLEMAKAIESLEPYFTPQSQFRDVSRGKPLPHSLSDDQKRAVGLTRETWQLEVVSDPDHPATLRRSLSKKETGPPTLAPGFLPGMRSTVRAGAPSSPSYPHLNHQGAQHCG